MKNNKRNLDLIMTAVALASLSAVLTVPPSTAHPMLSDEDGEFSACSIPGFDTGFIVGYVGTCTGRPQPDDCETADGNKAVFTPYKEQLEGTFKFVYLAEVASEETLLDPDYTYSMRIRIVLAESIYYNYGAHYNLRAEDQDGRVIGRAEGTVEPTYGEECGFMAMDTGARAFDQVQIKGRIDMSAATHTVISSEYEITDEELKVGASASWVFSFKKLLSGGPVKSILGISWEKTDRYSYGTEVTIEVTATKYPQGLHHTHPGGALFSAWYYCDTATGGYSGCEHIPTSIPVLSND